MLVLTRKHQEKIRIGDDIVITVLRTKGKAVRLGIEAPSAVPVIRGELAFESPRTDEVTAGIGEFSETASAVNPTTTERNHIPTIRLESSWATESPSQSSRDTRKSDPQVALRRIPREKLAEVLPRLASGSGPLRSMLDQRS